MNGAGRDLDSGGKYQLISNQINVYNSVVLQLSNPAYF